MDIIKTIDEMHRWSEEQRTAGNKIAFVPTMGSLHEGHFSLMREGKERADKLVVSIYVNPTQFAPTEDLTKYPRDREGDFTKSKEIGVDAIFFPSDEVMYPEGHQTYVTVEELSRLLCGVSRPTHFSGVTTVCAKLFNVVRPHIVLFGEKDYQQLVIIKRMVRDLNMPLDVVGMPIVREMDGLAMSSRNKYLNDHERKAALSLSNSIKVAQDVVAQGERDMNTIKAIVRETIESSPVPVIDYVEIVDPETLEQTSEPPARLLIAAVVGPTRLIDNCELA
jgi:pantoate--beta-alanine ligase